MSWVRIDDAAMTHPKILDLTDAAFRLWVWGLCYCQTHLTDGVIPRKALPAKSGRSAVTLVLARLWDALETGGYRVHDFLNWNDSKADVLRKREDAKKRAHVSRTRAERAAHVLSGVGEESSLSRKGSAIVPDDVGALAARFLERFQALYAQHRHGAHYHLKPNLDWLKVCELLRTWPSEHLEKLAQIILTTDDDWIAHTDRGVAILAAKASWADDRLKAWEAQRR